jgi:hypothetical protein
MCSQYGCRRPTFALAPPATAPLPSREAQAINDCLKANGKYPKVRWRWTDRASLPSERLGVIQSGLLD